MNILRRKSFTLIEIMVVVIILGILVSLVIPSYIQQKKKTEYKSALAQVKVIAAAEKDYFLTQKSYVTTANTTATNSILGIKIADLVSTDSLGNDVYTYFKDYRVNKITGSPATFNITVFSGTASNNALYTFDSDGNRIACSGTDCLP
ncbi:MAG: hypothetical protein AUJ74_04710 [Candidatus Omnitrophica bacterium CG1_02_44_16]|nr:MAG: hypothetical protein AUJ74_04710 [Candidatus Omnitrophica bacterium CG1_02_44_16]PIY82098.1 MAG: hypothetical protein COY78_08685 [Candidatus Omnitrophica bacterium CG_4_10_14_0_8_um_filter_44_12]PIZ83286.1 MAG: hypothetical protein COX96_08565 [Candidatus Omnitrophica bacterium CG_4_10_14_0_2_um_filter_44_9]